MQHQETNESTDSTNPESVEVEDQVFEEEQTPAPQQEKVSYEVVFFARYNSELYPRPSEKDIVSFFNEYGVVHHVRCPENNNFAFVFMTSLNTPEEHKRTRSTIYKIIQDMTPETKFRVTVASSNRPRYPQNQGNNNRFNGNQNDQYGNQQRRPFYKKQNYDNAPRQNYPRNNQSNNYNNQSDNYDNQSNNYDNQYSNGYVGHYNNDANNNGYRKQYNNNYAGNYNRGRNQGYDNPHNYSRSNQTAGQSRGSSERTFNQRQPRQNQSQNQRAPRFDQEQNYQMSTFNQPSQSYVSTQPRNSNKQQTKSKSATN